MKEAKPKKAFMVDANDFLRVIEKVDEQLLHEAFIGLWPDRNAFGQHLLDENDIATRELQEVPLWLRQYLRIDGDAYVRDLEHEGLYVVADVTRGVCVFDGPIVHSNHKS